MHFKSHYLAIAGLTLFGFGCGSQNSVSSSDTSSDVPVTHVAAKTAEDPINASDIVNSEAFKNQSDERNAPLVAAHLKGFVPELLKDHLADYLRDQLPNQVKSQVSDKVKEELAAHIQNNLSDEAKAKLAAHIEDALSDRLKGELAEHLKDSLSDRMKSELADRIKEALSQKMKAQLTEQLQEQLTDRFKARMAAKIKEELKERWQNITPNRPVGPVGWHNFDIEVKKRDKLNFAAGIANSVVDPSQGRTHVTRNGLVLGFGWDMNFAFNGETVDGRCASKVNTTINSNTGNGRLYGTFETRVRMDMPGTDLDGKIATFKGRLTGKIDLPVDRLAELEGADVDRERIFKSSIVSGRLTGHLVSDDRALRGVKLEARYTHGGGDEALTGVMHLPNGVKVVKVDIEATRVVAGR